MDATQLYHVYFDEVWNNGRIELAPDCLCDTYVRHDPQGNRTLTRDEYVAEIARLRGQMPDVRYRIDDQLITTDRIWVRWQMTATNAATGEAVRVSALQVHRVEGGRLAETWSGPAVAGQDWEPLDPAHGEGGGP